MNAQREGDVCDVAGKCAGALEGSRETHHIVPNIIISFGVEKGLPGAATGSPILTNILSWCDAKILVELFYTEFAKLILVEYRDLCPFFRVVEFGCINMIKLSLPEGRPFGIIKGDWLLTALNF